MADALAAARRDFAAAQASACAALDADLAAVNRAVRLVATAVVRHEVLTDPTLGFPASAALLVASLPRLQALVEAGLSSPGLFAEAFLEGAIDALEGASVFAAVVQRFVTSGKATATPADLDVHALPPGVLGELQADAGGAPPAAPAPAAPRPAAQPPAAASSASSGSSMAELEAIFGGSSGGGASAGVPAPRPAAGPAAPPTAASSSSGASADSTVAELEQLLGGLDVAASPAAAAALAAQAPSSSEHGAPVASTPFDVDWSEAAGGEGKTPGAEATPL